MTKNIWDTKGKNTLDQAQKETWPDDPAGHMAGGVQPAQQEPVSEGRALKLAMAEENDKRLEAQQQEPVALVSGYYSGQCIVVPTNPAMLFNSGTAFYTSTPASKPWVGLTDDDIWKVIEQVNWTYHPPTFARAIEAKLREKNAQQSKPLTDDDVIAIARKHVCGGLEFDSRESLLAFFKEAAYGIKQKTTSEN